MQTPADLAALGYHLVPWSNRKAAHRKPLIQGWLQGVPSVESVTHWMQQWPEADWAVVPDSFVVFDLENKNGLDGSADLARLCAEHGCTAAELYEAAHQTNTYHQGKHLYFRLPADCTLVGGVHISPGIEIKCRNGSAHIPGSEGYSAVRDLPAPAQLPLLPAWLMSLWAASSVKKSDGTQYQTPLYVNGQRRHMLCSMAGALRNLSLNEYELAAALKAVRDQRCEKGDEPFEDAEIEGIAKDYAKREASDYTGLVLAGDERALSVETFVQSQRITQVVDLAETAEAEMTAPEEIQLTLPDHILYPTPLIEEWVKYGDSTNPRHQPELMLMGCITALGCIMGRRWVWEGSKGNLYCLGLAPSSSGKERTHTVVKQLFDETGFGALLGAAKIGSEAGMVEELGTKPEILWVNDEFHEMVRALNMPAANPYLKGVERLLTELYPGNSYLGQSLKGVTPKKIEHPYPCLYAIAQPRTFWRHYNIGMTDSGFLGRFIIFNGRPHPPLDVLCAKNTRVPPPQRLRDMVAGCKTVYHEDLSRIQNLTGGLTEIDSDIGMHDYSDEIVLKCDAISQDAYKKDDNVMGVLYGRNTEKIKKLALIHAYSLNPLKPKMTKASLDWGFDILDYANRCLIDGLRSNSALRNTVQNDNFNQVFELIKGKKDRGMMTAELIRATSNMKKHDRNCIIEDLIESGALTRMARKAQGGVGRPSMTFYAKEYAPFDQRPQP